ncbi:MAG: DNA gyrase modulator, partial [Fervidicoccaceae archaeon]
MLGLIDEGSRRGAAYVEVRYQADSGKAIMMRNGRVLSLSSFGGEGVGIRILLDGGIGFSSTNSLNKSSLREALERALSAARVAGRLKRRKTGMSDERVGKASYEALQKRRIDDLSVDLLVERARDAEKNARDALKEARLSVFAFSLSSHVQEKLLLTSDGAKIQSRIPRLYASINFVLEDSGRTLQRWREFGGSGGAELLDEWKIEEEMREEASNLEVVMLRGISPPNEKLDLV